MLSILIYLTICLIVAGVLGYRIYLSTKTNNPNNKHD